MVMMLAIVIVAGVNNFIINIITYIIIIIIIIQMVIQMININVRMKLLLLAQVIARTNNFITVQVTVI